MGAEFTEDHAGMAELARAAFLAAELERRGERIRARAEELSPVRTGRYRRSWRLTVTIRDGTIHAQVSNDTPYAPYLEYGTRYMRRQRVLGRAIDAAGDER